MVSHDEIREIAMGMPGAIERASYGGRPSWRTSTRMFAWIRDHPEALVVWVESLDEKEALIASQPGKFFTTPHYDGEPIVLGRLEKLKKKEAVDLIVESWRNRATRTAVKQWDTERE